MKGVRRGCRLHGLQIIAFVLMTNHVHLVGCPSNGRLGDSLKMILGPYALWFNKRHARCGHLWQNRYFSKRCDTDEYLLRLVRYVHANPVRAHLVGTPADYEFSSWRWYAGRSVPDWADIRMPQAILRTPEAMRDFFAGDCSGGDRTFLQEREAQERDAILRARAGKRLVRVASLPADPILVELAAAVESEFRIIPGEMASQARASSLVAARHEFIRKAVFDRRVRQVEVARFLGLSTSQVSRSLARYR
jgi:REP element-mobilizing transposase RayT